MTVYLDWNATTPRHPSVREAMCQAEEWAWANPSSVHQEGRRARRAQEDTRELLGRTLNFSPRDIVFTSGGTEANHLALSGVRWLVTSRTEHPSIVAEAESHAERGAKVVWLNVDERGVVTESALIKALDEVLDGTTVTPLDTGDGGLTNQNTPLVALTVVNHETGVVQPIVQLAHVAHERGARLHVDAVQLLGRGPLMHIEGADSVAVASHKIRGPKGVGALGFDCGWTPLPLGRGGAQERGLRPGTVDATALAGFGAALSRLDASVRGYERAAELGAALRQVLTERARETIQIHGAGAQQLGHVVNFRATGWRGDELVAALDLQGLCVSSGSACSAGTAEPSAVIQAMLGRTAAEGAIRVSFGEESTALDLEALIAALGRLGVIRII